MILYFADRSMTIIGMASTDLPDGLAVLKDKRVDEIDVGVVSLEFYLAYAREERTYVSGLIKPGNYILRQTDDTQEFYTILDSEDEEEEAYVYAEDAGLDLINAVVGEYAASSAMPVTSYISLWTAGTGFEVGINEISDRSRKLSWEGEATTAERLASLAAQFDAEINFSFEIEGLTVRKKYINIYAKRGASEGMQLRMGYEIKSIRQTRSVANLATALIATGGTPENSDEPITLVGMTYDDGDIYLDNGVLKSRSGLEEWCRFVTGTASAAGHIVARYSYDTTSRTELLNRTVSELKKRCRMEVSYEVELYELPDSVQIGDTVHLIDKSAGLFLETRIMKVEESEAEQYRKAYFGDYKLEEEDTASDIYNYLLQKINNIATGNEELSAEEVDTLTPL